jgi:hypothetical protein
MIIRHGVTVAVVTVTVLGPDRRLRLVTVTP